MTEQTTEKKTRTKKRGHGEGSIFQRGNGTWAAIITTGYSPIGKRLRKWITGRTKKAVTDKLTRLQNQKLEGTLTDTGKMTVADLLDRWLEISAPERAGAGTLQRYDVLTRVHIKPLIGTVKLSLLKPIHIQSMLTTLEKNKVGDETRRYCFQVMRRAFNVAIRWDLLIRNPCARVDSPKVTRRQISPLTAEQSQELLRVADGFTDKDIIVGGVRNAALYAMAIATGMRQGELFALHWSEVDLESGILQVRYNLEEVKGKLTLKEPKSKAGKRSVKLPEFVVKALWQQKAQLMTEGLAKCPIVFPDTNGEFLRKSNFARRDWHPIRALAGIPATVRFHDLRHTSASLLLTTGIHPKIVQERLGHSKISLTMDTYSHLMPGMQDHAAATMDAALKSKVS